MWISPLWLLLGRQGVFVERHRICTDCTWSLFYSHIYKLSILHRLQYTDATSGLSTQQVVSRQSRFASLSSCDRCRSAPVAMAKEELVEAKVEVLT